MKIRVKSKEELLELFQRNDYEKFIDGAWGKSNRRFTFIPQMFGFCGETIEVEEVRSDDNIGNRDKYIIEKMFITKTFPFFRFYKDWVETIPLFIEVEEFDNDEIMNLLEKHLKGLNWKINL